MSRIIPGISASEKTRTSPIAMTTRPVATNFQPWRAIFMVIKNHGQGGNRTRMALRPTDFTLGPRVSTGSGLSLHPPRPCGGVPRLVSTPYLEFEVLARDWLVFPKERFSFPRV